MVIGSILSGFFTGLCAVIMGLTYGLPVWLVILLYPLIGSAGSLAFIARALTRLQHTQSYSPPASQMVSQNH